MAVEYSFKAPPLNISISPKPAERPPVGPEIGPDPRSATATLPLSQIPVMEGTNGVRFDFDFGPRVKMPDGNGKYRLILYDRIRQTELERVELSGGQLFVGEKKYFIQYRLEVYDLSDGKMIFHHDYDCKGKKVAIVIPDGGLGDNFAWLPFADSFRETYGADVICVCGEWLIRIVSSLYPKLKFTPVKNQQETKTSYASYFCAIYPKNRKTWRPCDHQNFGMQGSVAMILGVEPVNRKVRLPAPVKRTVEEPYVCISTMATNPAKYWNYPDGWNILCRYLKRLGYRVFVIDRDPHLQFAGKDYYVPSEAEDRTGWDPITERIQLLQNAEFFVGLPSGLSWVAWSCNIPVVMLAGFTLDGSEFPTPYRVMNPNFCHGCWNDSECFFDMTVPVWCPRHVGTDREIECTKMMTPKMVLDTVDRIPCVAERRKKLSERKIRLSVLTCVTSDRYIRECVASMVKVLAPYGEAEILLYNDGSEKEGLSVFLDKLAAEYPDIVRLWHGEKNVGVCDGRNFLASQAHGEYLMIFDHDDILLPFDVAGAVRFLDEHPEYCGSYAPKYLFNEKDGFLEDIHGSAMTDFSRYFALKVNINATILRKSDFDACGGFRYLRNDRKILGEDTFLLTRLLDRKAIFFDRIPRSLYRIHPDQLTAAMKNDDSGLQEIPNYVCDLHKDLADRILKMDFPPLDGPDGRLVKSMMGAVVFLNQQNRELVTSIVDYCKEACVDDPGFCEVYFSILEGAGKVDELVRIYPEYLKRFEQEKITKVLILTHVIRACRRTGYSLPEGIENEYYQARKEWLSMPDQVKEIIKEAMHH